MFHPFWAVRGNHHANAVVTSARNHARSRGSSSMAFCRRMHLELCSLISEIPMEGSSKTALSGSSLFEITFEGG
ncbi:hypothetical protein JTE90_028062 [Oedothorax gibbosus]|uniref:Uncharacterized protein n=1 Tax=Oedothorax gibbosus TaxID=931172 RepID=A0AAV6VA03_9ARAC|nr:hypothetical protein JTE90_028062 [Oedothorax gibbosus]